MVQVLPVGRYFISKNEFATISEAKQLTGAGNCDPGFTGETTLLVAEELSQSEILQRTGWALPFEPPFRLEYVTQDVYKSVPAVSPMGIVILSILISAVGFAAIRFGRRRKTS